MNRFLTFLFLIWMELLLFKTCIAFFPAFTLFFVFLLVVVARVSRVVSHATALNIGIIIIFIKCQPMAVIQLSLLDEFVNHSRIIQLEHMSDKLDILCRWTFSTSSIVNRSVALDSTGRNVLKNIGDSKTFFLSKAIARTIALSKFTCFYFENIIDST